MKVKYLLGFVCGLLFLGGCATQVNRPTRRVQRFKPLTRVKPKPRLAPGVLKAQCKSGVNDAACARVEQIRLGVRALTSLHKQQRTKLIARMAPMSKLLKRVESFPVSAVEIEKVDPKKWRSLNESYPLNVRLRLQYLNGKERHPKSSELMAQMTSLVKLADAQRKAWRELERKFAGPLDLGTQVAKERDMVSLTMLVSSDRFKERVELPRDLLDRFFGDLTETQHLTLSVVYDNGGKKRQYIAQQWLWVDPAFFVTSGNSGWFITESPKRLESKLFQVSVDADRYCDNLRAEVRHLERGKRPKISWVRKRKGDR